MLLLAELTWESGMSPRRETRRLVDPSLKYEVRRTQYFSGMGLPRLAAQC